ncbi:hypothetical protein RVM26_05055 [Halomonas sp. KM072]
MPRGRDWTTLEVAALRRGYARGVSAKEIGSSMGRTAKAVRVQAQKLGLVHKHADRRESVRLFEERQGKPLLEVAQEYRRRRLSRGDLAADIGIYGRTLRSLLPAELWQSWPHYTVGRRFAVEQRKH